MSKQSESVAGILETADAALYRDDLPASRAILAAGAAAHPESAALAARLVEVTGLCGEFAEAVMLARKAQAQHPQDRAVLLALGEALRQDQRPDEALAVHQGMPPLPPPDLELQAAIAADLIDCDRPDQALPILDRLTDEQPDRPELFVALARAKARLGCYREAVAYAGQVIEQVPDYILAHVILAESRRELGQEHWVEAARAAYSLNPAGPVTNLWMARVAVDHGTPTEAADHLTRALSAQPRLVEARVRLGMLHRDAGDLNTARDCFAAAVAQAPRSGLALGIQAHFLLATGLGQPDLDALERMADELPYSRLAFHLGVIYLKRNEMESAIRLLRSAVQAEPESVYIRLLLGQAHMRREQWDEAIIQFQLMIQLCPDAGEAYRGLGAALQNSGQGSQARAAYSEAVRLMPNSAQAHYGYGVTLAAHGDAKKARAQLRRARELEPSSGFIRLALAEVLADDGQLKEARQEARQAQELLGEKNEQLQKLLRRLSSRTRHKLPEG